MPTDNTKPDPSTGPGDPPEDFVVFAEEVRRPLSDLARDALLRALEEDREPTPTAIEAAKRYREAIESGRIRSEGISPTSPDSADEAGG